MDKQHNYIISIRWTGNKGTGTSDYKAFERSYSIIIKNKIEIQGSSDPAFLGDKTKHNPEELLIASLSSCHMLWYLHLCAQAKVIVLDYIDNATGIMSETANGSGHFTQVTLHPIVTVADISMVEKAKELHKNANELCFIANSVNFPIRHIYTIETLNLN